MLVDGLEGADAIVVIGVDDGKGGVDDLLGGQDGVTGAPGLDAALGDSVAGGQVLHLLEGVAHLHVVRHPLAYRLPEGGFDLVLDDKDHRLKARPTGVVEGVVDDKFSVGTHRVHLFQATVTAAHTGGHDH